MCNDTNPTVVGQMAIARKIMRRDAVLLQALARQREVMLAVLDRAAPLFQLLADHGKT